MTLLLQQAQQHRQSADGVATSDDDVVVLGRTQDMDDLAQELEFDVRVVPEEFGEHLDIDLVHAQRGNRLHGVDVVAAFGQAEEIAREEERGDATPAARQVAVRLDNAVANDEQRTGGGAGTVHDRSRRNIANDRAPYQLLALGIGEKLDRSATCELQERNRDERWPAQKGSVWRPPAAPDRMLGHGVRHSRVSVSIGLPAEGYADG